MTKNDYTQNNLYYNQDNSRYYISIDNSTDEYYLIDVQYSPTFVTVTALAAGMISSPVLSLQRILDGAALGLVVFYSSPLDLILHSPEILHADDGFVGVLCVVHGQFAAIRQRPLGDVVLLVCGLEKQISGIRIIAQGPPYTGAGPCVAVASGSACGVQPFHDGLDTHAGEVVGEDAPHNLRLTRFDDVTLTGNNSLSQPLTLTNGTASCTWSGLTDGQYTVTAAYNGDANYDTASDMKTFDISKQEQAALTIGSVGNKTYGDPAFTLSASGGSGSGVVTFASSDPTVISISGTSATIHKAGSATITASKAEDEDYNAATNTLSVTVGKKAVVFKANDKTVQLGGTMPTFDYAPVMLAYSDSITAEPTAACTATDTNTEGTFPITLSGAVLTNGDSYEISYQPGTLTVTVQSTYTVTVNGGTGSGNYTAGDTVTITATVPSGQRFTGWTVNEGGVTLANAGSATTTFNCSAISLCVFPASCIDTISGSSTCIFVHFRFFII